MSPDDAIKARDLPVSSARQNGGRAERFQIENIAEKHIIISFHYYQLLIINPI